MAKQIAIRDPDTIYMMEKVRKVLGLKNNSECIRFLLRQFLTRYNQRTMEGEE